ncbi:MAG: M2 family metallopeptidase [Bacteroidetes bacterium]|nr:M2 family metallopeptidase [Bacteroidota bacterium]
MKKILILVATIGIFTACNNSSSESNGNEKVQADAQKYLEIYNSEYQRLTIAANEASWKSNTYIVEGDTATKNATNRSNEAIATYTGSNANIDSAKKYLAIKEQLTELQVKQFQFILYNAANNPESLKDMVKERIAAETEQNDKLFGYNFMLDGKKVSTNDIDAILNKETNVEKREKAWESSKQVGLVLKDGLANLQKLRNNTVKPLGFPDYFNYQVSDYGMSTEEMMKMNQQMIKDIWPLYRELHTWARYELAKKYNVKEVPEYLPAHWLSNRWGQDWSGLVEVKGLNLDSVLKSKSKEWMVEQAERFYVSLGLPSLPKSFYEKSDLYPAPADAKYKKNNHASAWHMDLDQDVRSLMSITPNSEWYETLHHELGHIYYYLCYSNPDVPIVLRSGANRAYHEGFGSMIGMAAMQKPFLAGLNLIPADAKTDETQTLLKEALNYIVFIPWSAGVMTNFEHELYSNNLATDKYNATWWNLVKKYQGIVPPNPRGEEYCDAASKTHINNDAAQYYDYALSYLFIFQVHEHIAKEILHQDPHATNYYGNKEVGTFLKNIMSPGASKDWREVFKANTGEDLSAKAMLNYFMPLMDYLKKENAGRKYTLPEAID